jgi:hypothetical protein
VAPNKQSIVPGLYAARESHGNRSPYNIDVGHQRFYDDEEAEEILRRAASFSTTGQLTHDRLLETAAELGITPEAVERAQREYDQDRTVTLEQTEFDAAQRREFYHHLLSYVTVNAVLLILNLVTDPHSLWFFWCLLGWGIGLLFHAASVFFRSSEGYRQQFEKWRANKRLLGDGNALSGPPNEAGLSVGVHFGPRTIARIQRIQEREQRLMAKHLRRHDEDFGSKHDSHNVK